MPEIQIGNARRIGFTALALVVLPLVVQGAYEFGYCFWQDIGDHCYQTFFVRFTVDEVRLGWRWLSFPSLALLPTLFLSVSVHNSPRKVVRDLQIHVSSLLFLGSVLGGYWLGSRNGLPTTTFGEWMDLVNAHQDLSTTAAAARVREELRVSWLWLLLPIILTTAFVIFGAWRREVRDADVEAVGEDADE